MVILLNKVVMGYIGLQAVIFSDLNRNYFFDRF